MTVRRILFSICVVFGLAFQETVAKREESWDCFQFAHTIDPGTRELKYWDSARWTDLINERAKVTNQTFEGCKSILYKSTLPIIVASGDAATRLFPTTPSLDGKTLWSRDVIQTYVVKNKSGKRTIFDCGPLFVKAKLGKDNKPVRLESVNYKTGRFTDTINVKKCKEM